MAKEPALDARTISATVKIEVCRKVESKFRYDERDSLSVIYARALEEATRDVELTVEDYAAIQKEMERNAERRKAKRAKKVSAK